MDILVNHLQRQQPDLAPIRLEPQNKKLIKPKSTGWDLPDLQSGLRFQEGLQLITINWKHHSLECMSA